MVPHSERSRWTSSRGSARSAGGRDRRASSPSTSLATGFKDLFGRKPGGKESRLMHESLTKLARARLTI